VARQQRATAQAAKSRGILDRVAEGLKGIRPVNVQDAVQVVFQVLNHHVEPGQVQKVREALPEAVRELWPAQGGKGKTQSAA
jgi:uncharacterized protein (DUF2267 family)